MATEEYSVGYEAGYQEGWNKAIDSLAQPAQEPAAFDAFLESEDFYELMQAYRHFPIDALVQFEAVKDALRTAHNVKERNS